MNDLTENIKDVTSTTNSPNDQKKNRQNVKIFQLKSKHLHGSCGQRQTQVQYHIKELTYCQ